MLAGFFYTIHYTIYVLPFGGALVFLVVVPLVNLFLLLMVLYPNGILLLYIGYCR
jgi:hypothetical protein